MYLDCTLVVDLQPINPGPQVQFPRRNPVWIFGRQFDVCRLGRRIGKLSLLSASFSLHKVLSNPGKDDAITMPLTMRPIPHALNLGAPEIYGQGSSGEGSHGTQVLEDVNMASMVGTLAQLGALATVSK